MFCSCRSTGPLAEVLVTWMASIISTWMLPWEEVKKASKTL